MSMEILPLEAVSQCYLCHGTRFDYKMPYRATPNDSIFFNCRIIKCKECGLLQIDRKFTSEAIENYYKDVYDREQIYNLQLFEFPLDNKWSVSRGRALAKLVKYLNICKKSNPCVMDLGCGYGHLLYGFDNYFENKCTIIGVDYDEKTKQVFEKYDWTFKLGGVDDIYEEYIGNIDILITSHVFEHVINPHDFLNKCGAMLSQNGVLLWEMPNSNEFNLECDPRHSPHICLWDVKTIQEILTRNNFEIIFLQTAGKKYTWLDKKKFLNKSLNRLYRKINRRDQDNFNIDNKESIGFELDVYGSNRRNIRLVAKRK